MEGRVESRVGDCRNKMHKNLQSGKEKGKGKIFQSEKGGNEQSGNKMKRDVSGNGKLLWNGGSNAAEYI